MTETEIKVYEEIYTVELKNWKTYELPAQAAVPMKQERAKKNKQCVLLLGDDAVDGFEITWFYKKEVASDVDVYILSQSKQIRDRLAAYAKDRNIRWNNIDHVSNVIQGINEGNI